MDDAGESNTNFDAPSPAHHEPESTIVANHEPTESCMSPPNGSDYEERRDLAIDRSMGTPASIGKDEGYPITISDATDACRQSFEECLRIDSLMKKEWAENRLADFNLWAAGVGASAKQRASLDDRLAFKPDVRAVVLNLLVLLRILVYECKKLGTSCPRGRIFLHLRILHVLGREDTEKAGSIAAESESEMLKIPRGRNSISVQGSSQRSFSPWSDVSGSSSTTEAAVAEKPPLDSALAEATKNAESIFDQLARLAVAIRRSGTSSRLHKADGSFDPSNHEDLQKHLIPRDSTVNFSLDAESLSLVQKRLIRANLKRRNRFVYAQRHAEKLEARPMGSTQISIPNQEVVSSAMEGPKPADNEGHAQRTVESTEVGQKPVGHGKSQITAPHAAEVTDTTASAVGTASLADPTKISTPSQQAKTEVSTTGSRLNYPRPPRVEAGRKSFKCPCCCQTLPKLFAEGRRWRSVLELPSGIDMGLIQWSQQEAYHRRSLSVHLCRRRLPKT